MSDEQVPVTTAEHVEVPEAPEAPPLPNAPPIKSRFLYVDVAAQRAKQLRRGAKPRVPVPDALHKLERVAMREVNSGFIDWSLPPYKGAPAE